tara:strand:+ start:676 stop:1302 length:627 start_codon:yes stop_codon:yes gene_type:complete
MTYKNNVDILTWKRVIQNLQEKTDETVESYNDAQNEASLGLEQSEEINTEHYKVVVSSNDMGIVVDVHDQHGNVIKSDQHWDEDVMQEEVESSDEPVTEGTWSIPDTPEKVKELKDLMQQELPADEAQDKIYGILGDDELFDDIAEMADKDPKADVRGMIVRRLDDLGLLKKKVDEEKQRLDPECWDGYHKDGTKMKSGVRVNNCVKD